MVPMMPSSVRFLEPSFLWALVIPGVLVLIWTWQFWKRRVDVRRLLRNRTLPERERYPLAGELAFWLCLILALACLAGALARPQLRVNVVQRAGLDFVDLAGWLDLDARHRRRAEPMGAFDNLAPDVCRDAELDQ